jgi:hypothetical protein
VSTPVIVAMAETVSQDIGQSRRPSASRGDNLQPVAMLSTVPCNRRDMRWGAPAGTLPIVAVRASSSARTHAAANTIDRDLTTRWAPSAEGVSWVEYDLGSPQPVSGVSLVWYGRSPRGYGVTVQGSADGVVYNDLCIDFIRGRGTQVSTWSFEKTDAVRFVRLGFSSAQGAKVPNLLEASVLGASVVHPKLVAK